MSAEMPLDLLKELSSLAPPQPQTRFVSAHLAHLSLDLPVEFRRFLLRSITQLRLVVREAPPVPVYLEDSLAADRLGDLVEQDARLRSGVDTDLLALESFLTALESPLGDLPALLRAVNRILVVFAPLEGDLAMVGRIVCSSLLHDLLEISTFT
jgi:hypothetical protein